MALQTMYMFSRPLGQPAMPVCPRSSALSAD